MRYNSIDHFLTAQHAAIIAVMVAAQQQAGGHYAALTSDALWQNAVQDVQEVVTSIRDLKVDNPAVRASAEENVEIGVDLDDLIRMGLAFEQGFLVLVKQEVQDQEELATELNRRVLRLGARFRTNVTGVKLDQTLKRLKKE